MPTWPAAQSTPSLANRRFSSCFDATVNQNGTSYMYLAMRQNDVPLFVTTTADTSNGTTTSNLALRANQGGDVQYRCAKAIAARERNAQRQRRTRMKFSLRSVGSGTQVISLASTLTVTDGVSIDGTTQSGWLQNSFMPIVLDGNNGAYSGLTLSSTADGSLIRVSSFATLAVMGSESNPAPVEYDCR